MNGFQVYLKDDSPFVHGHINFVASPWALTAVSQQQFWPKNLTEYGNGSVRGCLSVDISDWETPGILYGKPARQLTSAEEVANEVLAQMRAALSPELAGALDPSNVERWFLDPDIVMGDPVRNQEPLLINTAGSWKDRPDAATAIPNFFLASDFVRTFTDLATMEGANEAARRAVNAILARSGSRADPCHLWRLQEPLLFAPLREYDRLRFELGLPNALRERIEPPHGPGLAATPVDGAPIDAGEGPGGPETTAPAAATCTHAVDDLPIEEPHEGD